MAELEGTAEVNATVEGVPFGDATFQISMDEAVEVVKFINSYHG